MNAAVIVFPLVLIRFGLLGLLNKNALKRAAVFPKPAGHGRLAYWSYLITEAVLLLYPVICKINTVGTLFYIGLGVYLLGTLIYLVAVVNFARPESAGINTKGLYSLSRNPMYVGFFLYFLGCALITHSLVLLAALVIFQISTHWIILAEEQWCLNEFGESYLSYKKRVRRYL